MKLQRYQIYLNPHTVSILDEAAAVSGYSRSRLIQEALNAASDRMGVLLAEVGHEHAGETLDYSWLDGLEGAVELKSQGVVAVSENVDEMYTI